MNETEIAVGRHVRRLRPDAKFVHVSHSRDYMEAWLGLGEGFYKANLYDERIDANLIETVKFGPILLQNTYLTSFAYNMFLCWLGGKRQLPGLPPLDTLLAHNFKKFFAEQIYRLADRVPARALLLETLLFEQVAMVPVFAAKETDAQLSEDSDKAAELMSLVLAMHEYGHFVLKTNKLEWSRILLGEPEIVGTLYIQIMKSCDPNTIEEFQCDAHAVLGCLHAYKDYRDPTFAFRTLAFSYCAYAAMYSALKTAEQTARLWTAVPEQVNLLDISKAAHVDYDVSWGVHDGFVQRTRWVLELCERCASRSGVSLYGEDGPFPLPATILEDLLRYVGRVFDSADENARKMSNLVAQALGGCEDGMEYLYLRSKTFQSNRGEPLTLSPDDR